MSGGPRRLQNGCRPALAAGGIGSIPVLSGLSLGSLRAVFRGYITSRPMRWSERWRVLGLETCPKSGNLSRYRSQRHRAEARCY